MTLHLRSSQSRRPTTPKEWATYLHALADPIVNPLDLSAEFAHAFAKPFMLSGPLFLHILHTRQNLDANTISAFSTKPATPAPISESPNQHPDLYLWWALADSTLDPLQIIDLQGNAAIVPQDLCTTIEVWTETELAALHAISHHLAKKYRDNQKLQARLERALTWHIENTQPDNATNHPWAVQTFLQANTPESLHYAETLLSNCAVQNAQPDPFSAWILIDAARALENSA